MSDESDGSDKSDGSDRFGIGHSYNNAVRHFAKHQLETVSLLGFALCFAAGSTATESRTADPTDAIVVHGCDSVERWTFVDRAIP